MQSKQNRSRKLSRFAFNKRAITVILFAVVGTSLVFVARAEKYSDVVLPNGFMESSQVDIPNGVATIKVGSQLTNFSSSTTYQANLAFFSDINRVEYVSYTCDPRITCVDSNWSGYDYYASNHMDAKVTDLRLCITVPPGFSIAQSEEIITLHYKVLALDRPFWLEFAHGAGPGSCQSNPSATGVGRGDGAYGQCFNMHTSEPGCEGSGGFGTGRALPGSPYTDSGGTTGGNGDGANGQGIGTGQDSGGGGGGSSATTQSNQPNSLPSSSEQGTSEQPQIEPSPFFDGKLFVAGSDAFDDANTVSIAGFKLGYGWLYLATTLAVLGIAGFFGWRYREQLRGALISLRRKLRF